jgi:hypothetical protein
MASSRFPTGRCQRAGRAEHRTRAPSRCRSCCGPHGERVDRAIQAARESLGADAPILIDLVQDDDPGVRIFTAWAMSTALTLPPAAATALRTRLAVEDDPAVRISLVLAIAQLDASPDEVEQWWRDPAQPADVRFAASLAWLCLTDAPAPNDLTVLFGELTTPQMQQAFQRVPWPTYDFHDGLAGWLAKFLETAPDTPPSS